MQHDANRAIHFADEGPGLLRRSGLPLCVGDDHPPHCVGGVAEQLNDIVLDFTADPVAIGGEAQLLALELGDRRIRTDEVSQGTVPRAAEGSCSWAWEG